MLCSPVTGPAPMGPDHGPDGGAVLSGVFRREGKLTQLGVSGRSEKVSLSSQVP